MGPLLVIASVAVAEKPSAQDAKDIGSRRELFVDRQLVDSLDGVRLEVQQPEPQQVVLVTGEPWEGSSSRRGQKPCVFWGE